MLLSTASRLGASERANVRPFMRMMGSFVSRRPVKIVNWDKIEASNPETPSSVRNKRANLPTGNVLDTGLLQEEKLGLNEQVDENAESQKKSLPHIVEQKDDLKFSKYMIRVKSRAQRKKAGIILLEGKKLVKDALASGIKLEALFVSRRRDIAGLDLPAKGVYLAYLPYKYFEKWSDVVTPPGVLGVFKLPSLENMSPDPKSIPLTVICDNIRDPGNMGAILRVLAGVGCQKIFVMRGCVDIWEPKVLRAACGGHFRVPIEHHMTWKDMTAAIDDNASVFLADCDQISENDVHSDLKADEEFSSDQDISSSINDSHPQPPSDDACIGSSNLSVENIKSLHYYDMKFKFDGPNILVVSNESVGVSNEALEFASNRNGVKVHIPLCGKVESLNVVSALSIIAFEMKRQAALFKVTEI